MKPRLTTTEVARLLNRKAAYVCGLIKAGRLSAIKLTPDGNWLIDPDSVERLVGRRMERQPNAADIAERERLALMEMGMTRLIAK